MSDRARGRVLREDGLQEAHDITDVGVKTFHDYGGKYALTMTCVATGVKVKVIWGTQKGHCSVRGGHSPELRSGSSRPPYVLAQSVPCISLVIPRMQHGSCVLLCYLPTVKQLN